jgi:hypothetical protein
MTLPVLIEERADASGKVSRVRGVAVWERVVQRESF